MNSSVGSVCPFCPDITLDPLGHHVMSCMQKWWRCGHQTQSHANHFFLDFSRAHLSVHVEAGHGLLGVKSNSCPVHVLFDGWEGANPVAVSYLLLPLWGILVNQQELQLIQQSVESTLPVTQSVKNWGESVFPLLLKCMAIRVKEHASFLSIRQCCPKSKIILEISLVRSVARAILSRRVVLGFNVL